MLPKCEDVTSIVDICPMLEISKVVKFGVIFNVSFGLSEGLLFSNELTASVSSLSDGSVSLALWWAISLLICLRQSGVMKLYKQFFACWLPYLSNSSGVYSGFFNVYIAEYNALMSDKVMLTSQFTGLVTSANFALSLPISPFDPILLVK